jgi:hypothetical protein
MASSSTSSSSSSLVAVHVRFFLLSHLFAMITPDLNLQALANLSRLVCSLDFVSVFRSLFIGWLSVTTDALIVESSPWYVSPLPDSIDAQVLARSVVASVIVAFVVGHSHLPRTAHDVPDTYVYLHRRLLASPRVKSFT